MYPAYQTSASGISLKMARYMAYQKRGVHPHEGQLLICAGGHEANIHHCHLPHMCAIRPIVYINMTCLITSTMNKPKMKVTKDNKHIIENNKIQLLTEKKCCSLKPHDQNTSLICLRKRFSSFAVEGRFGTIGHSRVAFYTREFYQASG